MYNIKYGYKLIFSGSDSESYAGNVLFPGLKRKNADESIKQCVKYLANYWFHEFGLEVG